MKKTKQKANLKKLLRLWDKKLAKAKFKDIEDRESELLKTWSWYERKDRRNPDTRAAREAKAQYYREVGLTLHSKEFKNRLYKKIWSLHADGNTAYFIGKTLKLSRRQVYYAIELMEKEFGIGLSQSRNSEASQGSDNATDQQTNRNSRRRTV